MDIKTDFIDQVARIVVVELECQLQKKTDVKIARIEGTMREMLRDVGAHCLGVYLTQQDEAYPKSEAPCPCGGMAAYRERRDAKILSVFGWISYQ